MTTLLYKNELVQKQKNGMYVAGVGVYKAPMHCIPNHRVISDILWKATDLSAFNKGKNGYGSATGNVDIENDRFGRLFTSSHCEHASKMAYRLKTNKSPATGVSPWHIDSRGQRRLLCIIRRDQRPAIVEISIGFNIGDLVSVSQHRAMCPIA